MNRIDQPAPSRFGQALVVAGIVLLALNLRPAAVSVGPVLDEIRSGLGMSAIEAGILTSLPVVAFAVFGALAPRISGRFGLHRLVTVSLLMVVVGLLGRSRVDAVPAFLGLSLLALAAMATANVVLPSLVKLHFPDRIGRLTAVYSTALAVGLTSASVVTVPVSNAQDGWRSGLAVWALLALVALVPWVFLLRHDRPVPSSTSPKRISLADVARTRLGWLMAAFFGLQSLQAYAIFGWFAVINRDAGFSSTQAGVLLGVVTGTSIPFSFIIPSLAGRLRNTSGLVWGLGLCYPIGYLGVAFAPSAAPYVWAAVIGAGTATFPLVLTLLGLRTRTAEGTASLSAFTQSIGYLMAAIGPFGMGLLRDLSGGWVVPLLALTALVVPLVMAGLAVSTPCFLEDQLESHRVRAS